MRHLVLAASLFACGPASEWGPVYPGEPKCGSMNAVHAVEGTACPEAVDVACDCAERKTLECVGGVWTYSHWLCSGGLGLAP